MIDITVRKHDVKVKTNEENRRLVDVILLPAGEMGKGNEAQAVTVTLEYGTARRLHEALGAYRELDGDI